MGIFERFRQSGKTESTILTGDNLLTALISDGEDLTRSQIMNIPQVAADIDLITSIFATIPFRLYRRTTDDDGNEKIIRLDDDDLVPVRCK